MTTNAFCFIVFAVPAFNGRCFAYEKCEHRKILVFGYFLGQWISIQKS